MCVQKRATERERWMEGEGKRRGMWIIVEPEKDFTLLLSHYRSSGGTAK